MRALLACCLLASVQAFLCSRAAQRGAAQRRAAQRGALRAAQDDEDGLMVTIAKARRPLGVILEEREDGRGVEVLDIDPSGNAAGEDVLVGDRVLMVDAAQCADEGFDAVAGRIGSSAGDRVELTLGRRVGTVRIIWPNGVQSGALPGEPLQELATKARYPVKYACTSGSCGTCEHRLRTPATIFATRAYASRGCRRARRSRDVAGDRF